VSTAVAPALDVRGGASFGNVVRAEWTKLRSLRSTWWTVLAAFVVTVGLSVLIDWAIVANWEQSTPQDRATFDPTNSSLAGLSLGQLAVAVLGVMALTSEYSTGGIRTTFTAVPRRLRVLGAKVSVVVLLGLATGLVTSFVAFGLGQLFFASRDVSTSLGAPHVLRAVVGAGLYVAGCGMFGLALGTIVRNTPGAVTAVVALLFVLPLLTLAIPGDVGETISDYFTANAGTAITFARTPPGTLQPWTGFAVFTLEWVVLLVAGAVLLRRRDA
jgi:ABC-2 type transport system permease protein